VPVLRRSVRTLVELGQRRRAAVTQRVLATALDALGDPAGAAAVTADAEALAGPLDDYAAEQLRQVLLLTR
jgi:predicted Zn-dependent protease